MIKITLPDGSVREYEKGTTSLQIAQSISEGLARNVLAAKVNQEVWDASRPIQHDASLSLLTWNDALGQRNHVALLGAFNGRGPRIPLPGCKILGWTAPLENGFYYDVDLNGQTLTPADFEKIEQKMLELARQNNVYVRKEISKSEAISYFTEKGDEYKLDLLERLEDGNITLYSQGNFTDLCRGPHIPNTGFIKAAKIQHCRRLLERR